MASYEDIIASPGDSLGDLTPFSTTQQSLKGTLQAFSSLLKHIKTISDIRQEITSKINDLKTLRDDISCIFEWHDGILVEAME